MGKLARSSNCVFLSIRVCYSSAHTWRRWRPTQELQLAQAVTATAAQTAIHAENKQRAQQKRTTPNTDKFLTKLSLRIRHWGVLFLSEQKLGYGQCRLGNGFEPWQRKICSAATRLNPEYFLMFNTCRSHFHRKNICRSVKQNTRFI
jgi:hypothetical protein